MNNIKTNIYDTQVFKYGVYHKENIKWLQNLAFYREELAYFYTLIDEVKSKNTLLEVLNQVFVFETRWQNLHKESDELVHLINQEQWGFEDDALGREFLLGEEIYDQHYTLRERYQVFEKEFIHTKNDFYKCLSKIL
ncbi:MULTISPECIES: hypothetical protein [unclassified Arcicella]|uniref:hypothetical protein n=1 Tax=unclassified Arcicella TaxID=2644986 RepID=UPI0028653CF1|nr:MULTISPECIES: hypothetical protein [unclassified Arcicella]MDR6560750.1 hypothetical protein [Arcicella sp. BE51]MDR6810634.1 hypothetical protein [Arcicella sp. BE140]MDR6821984.1 hypothetical protein [Arcicella sp. BE139]